MKKYFVAVLAVIMAAWLFSCQDAAEAYDVVLRIDGTFPDGVVDKNYGSIGEVTCNFTCNWEIVKGELPPGLRFATLLQESRLWLTGKPTQEGTYTFTLRASYVEKKQNVSPVEKEFTINITYDKKYDPKEQSKITGEFPDGVVGKAYRSTLDVKFSWSGCKWELEDGELPPGLYLDLLGWQEDDRSIAPILPTDVNAYLHGIPEEAGEYTFTVRATRRDNARYTDTKTFTVTISEQNPPDPPDPEDPEDPEEPQNGNNGNTGGGGGGGGGCNSGFGILMLAVLVLKRSR
ncbi:MAG: hypothetical protein IJS28_08325 [Synergistaceae bacterium]|nr:hypothetical protein [Synergistaceae bacterium]